MKPNILYIVSDDLGFADLGCYNGRDARFGAVSPHIDALAAGGLRMTDGYSNAPVCSPTRFALMTMRYQYRFRGALEEPINSRSKGSTTLGLPGTIPTLPSLLRDAGYATTLIGKWHLGYPPTFGPLKSGYDEFFGIMAGGVDYFTHCSTQGDHDLYLGEAEHRQVGYLTDVLSKRAVEYIEQAAPAARKGRPFMMSLHYTAPHWPWETREDADVPKAIGNKLFHLDGGNIHSYHRMIHHMDEGIGKIVALLQRESLLENTLIVFTSDNGGERFSDNWPLVGGKMDLTEGGIRVPWIAHWPRRIAAGTTSAQHCMTMDWSTTLLEAGGGAPHPDYPLDGVSLMPVLPGPAANTAMPTNTFERPMHWRMNFRAQRARRDGQWKYLKVEDSEFLFDIEADARERANLAHRYPDRLARMRGEWEAWNLTVPPIPEDATYSAGFSVKDMPQR